MDSLSFRPASEADIPFLLDLRRRTMNAHQVLAGLIPSDEERLKRVLLQFEHARIILRSGEPVGLLKVQREGTVWELVQIQLAPSLQGKGIGTVLLGALIQEARSESAGLRLSVLRGSPARRLYERMGFSVVAEDAHAFEMTLEA